MIMKVQFSDIIQCILVILTETVHFKWAAVAQYILFIVHVHVCLA